MTLKRLLALGHEPTGFFFNPNIHPLAEYLRRRAGAAQVCLRLGLPAIFADALPRQEQTWGASPAGTAGEASGLIPCAAESSGLPPAVDPRPWLRLMSGREAERCPLCWRIRLAETVKIARSKGFEGFSSSLLYSRHQDHQSIRQTAENLAASSGLTFVYEDFRGFWREGIEISKAWGIYRQQYCGCLYSEYDRYARDGAKAWGD
jgi:predicted adenine nucleotide alpha hydrolase (AANH) superfamily ATPase